MSSDRTLASLLLLTFLIAISSYAQAAEPIWGTETLRYANPLGDSGDYLSAQVHSYSPEALDSALPRGRGADTTIDVITPSGTLQEFKLLEHTTLSPELQAALPELRTFRGYSVEDESVELRLTVSPSGVRVRVFGDDGWSIETSPQVLANEVVLWTEEEFGHRGNFECLVTDSIVDDASTSGDIRPRAWGASLRTYDIAVSGTGEFTVFHGGLAAAQLEITSLVNAANVYFERELAAHMNLVDINAYADPATDPYSNGLALNTTLLDENHSALVTKLGSGAFDIGHVISKSSGGGASGLAYLSVVCSSFWKGGGGTVSGTPTWGSIFDVFLHEIGHQLGASHSFNSTIGGCNGNRSGSSAYEIGSGMSIMSYAGLCGIENVTTVNSFVYNSGSLQQITAKLGSVGCGATSPTGNGLPVADAGPNYTIPRETAFVLDGSASYDPDGDPLDFSWEQHDLGTASPPVDMSSGPLFRNFDPTSDPLRSVPLYALYRGGGATPWEFLPTVDRQINFRLIVRDNNAGGGGIDWDTTTLTVSGAPFEITSPNGGESVPGGAPTLVTWDVGGGAVATDVRMLFSDDSGVTWTEFLASTPNDGSQSVSLPCGVTTQARLRIEPVGNIFFDISDSDFSVTADTTPPVVTCPAPFVVTATGPAGIDKDDPALDAWKATVVVDENCDLGLTATFATTPTIPVGVNNVTFFATDSSANSGFCTTQLTVEALTGRSSAFTNRTALLAVTPNPFNPRTSVQFYLKTQQRVHLEVLDMKGRRIDTVFDGRLGDGQQELVWDAQGFASGVYVARLSTEDGTFTRRLVLLK